MTGDTQIIERPLVSAIPTQDFLMFRNGPLVTLIFLLSTAAAIAGETHRSRPLRVLASQTTESPFCLIAKPGHSQA